MSKLATFKILRDTKYNKMCMKLNEQRPTKIIWEYPDTVEMTDKDGKIHIYSIIELLDGLQRLARVEKRINIYGGIKNRRLCVIPLSRVGTRCIAKVR